MNIQLITTKFESGDGVKVTLGHVNHRSQFGLFFFSNGQHSSAEPLIMSLNAADMFTGEWRPREVSHPSTMDIDSRVGGNRIIK